MLSSNSTHIRISQMNRGSDTVSRMFMQNNQNYRHNADHKFKMYIRLRITLYINPYYILKTKIYRTKSRAK